MNCPKCNTPNPENAQFCSNCGSIMNTRPVQQQTSPGTSDEQTIKALLIVMGIDYLCSIIMFIVQKIYISSMYASGSSEYVGTIYQYLGWSIDIISIGAMVFFLSIIKNSRVQMAFGIFLVIKIILLIGYRVVPFIF
jgi:predicted nucleic acid-binding Zn ribbon protein